MRSIYEHASDVTVWLESAPEGIDQAFTAARRPGKLKRFHHSGPEAQSLRQLLDRAWWNRVWAVQELFAAQTVTVQCGEYSIPWQQFEKLIGALDMVTLIYSRSWRDDAVSRSRVHSEVKKLARLRETKGVWDKSKIRNTEFSIPIPL
jgi:hypothetical protein